jgi:hypothetical protein
VNFLATFPRSNVLLHRSHIKPRSDRVDDVAKLWMQIAEVMVDGQLADVLDFVETVVLTPWHGMHTIIVIVLDLDVLAVPTACWSSFNQRYLLPQ